MPINGDTVLGRRTDLPGYSSRTDGYRLAGRPIAATPSVPAGDVMTARSEDRLILWYLPKIDVATRKLAGAEGLLRLVDPELGVLSPAAFLPGLTGIDMAVITAFVAERAIADWFALRRCRRVRPPVDQRAALDAGDGRPAGTVQRHPPATQGLAGADG